MRRVYRYKLPSPDQKVLSDIQDKWNTDSALRISTPKWKESVWRGRYRTFLHRIHGGHCAFCETTVTAGTNGDVEHFYPKSRYHTHKFRWDNWLLSCSNCNGAKGNIDTQAVDWIDPRDQDPWRLLRILPTGALEPASSTHKARAANTIDGADLNCVRTTRSDQLKDQRQSAILHLRELIHIYTLVLGQKDVRAAALSAVVNVCVNTKMQFSGVCLCDLYWQVKAGKAPKELLKRAVALLRSQKLKPKDVFA